MMKNTKVILLSMASSLMLSFVSFAGVWQQDEGGSWKYLDDDNEYVTQDWRWIDGDGNGTFECYYFADGSAGNIGKSILVTGRTTPDGAYVNEDGAYAKISSGEGIVKWSPENNEEIYEKWLGNYYYPGDERKIEIYAADENGMKLKYEKYNGQTGTWEQTEYDFVFSVDKMAAFYNLYDENGKLLQHESCKLDKNFHLETSLDNHEFSIYDKIYSRR